MTFAAFVLWLMHHAFTQVLPSDEAARALSAAMREVRTQPWYEGAVFAEIADKVSSRMPKALSQPETAGTSMVDLIECANACGYSLTHQTDFSLLYKFDYCSIAFFSSMKEVASAHQRDGSI
jgi:hypothetical protein